MDSPVGCVDAERKRQSAAERQRRKRLREKLSLLTIEFDVPADQVCAAMCQLGRFVRPPRGRLPDFKKLEKAYVQYLKDDLSELSRRDCNILQKDDLREIVRTDTERVDVVEVGEGG